MQTKLSTIRYHQRYYSLTNNIPIKDNESSLKVNRKESLSKIDIKENQVFKLQKQQELLLQQIKGRIENGKIVSKIQKIRVQQWCNKLMVKPSNVVWKKNINFYLKVLLEMINQEKLMQPFLTVPNDGPLANLSLYNLPFPIRQIFERKQSKEKSVSNNSLKKQQTNKQVNYKGKSIKFNEDLFVSEEKQNKPSQILYRKQSKNQVPYENVINSNLKMDLISYPPSMTSKKLYKNKNSINKSSQNSKNYSFGKNNQAMRKLQNDYNENDKENNPYILNNQEINRKLFKSKEKEVSLTTMATQYTSMMQKDYHYLDESSIHQIKYRQNADTSLNILSKIYKFFNEEKELLEQKGAKKIMQRIKQMGNQLGIKLGQDDSELDSSILSQRSQALKKASQNIKLKFQETSIQTIQFMDFLQNVRNKNIK